MDYAYLVVNLGIDVFYIPNQAYILRQVVTNSKGQKVEILWPAAYYDEMTMMSFGTAPVWEITESTWDPIPGELPIRVSPEYDLVSVVYESRECLILGSSTSKIPECTIWWQRTVSTFQRASALFQLRRIPSVLRICGVLNKIWKNGMKWEIRTGCLRPDTMCTTGLTSNVKMQATQEKMLSIERIN